MVFSLPLTAFAVDNYIMNINEPAKGDNQGYILLFTESAAGNRSVVCISWTLLPIYTDANVTYNASEMMIDISNTSNVIHFIGRSHGNYQMSAGFGRCLSGESRRTTFWDVWDNSIGVSYDYNLGTNTVLGYQCYGNGVVTSHDLGDNNNLPFTVSWGSDNHITSKLTELIALATQMCDNDEKLLAELDKILSDTSSIDENTDELEALCANILSWLARMDARLKDIQGYTYTTVQRLDTIISILKGQGESTFEEPNTEGISEYDKAEDELVSGAEDTSDIESQIEDFEIDANASGKIWDIITQFFNCHPKIMGLVIGILCLGIIALILNR